MTLLEILSYVALAMALALTGYIYRRRHEYEGPEFSDRERLQNLKDAVRGLEPERTETLLAEAGILDQDEKPRPAEGYSEIVIASDDAAVDIDGVPAKLAAAGIELLEMRRATDPLGLARHIVRVRPVQLAAAMKLLSFKPSLREKAAQEGGKPKEMEEKG